MLIRSVLAASAFCFFATTSAFASGSHNAASHQETEVLMPMAEELPTQTGQSAFAAIAEIVTLLENDPATDWSKVNIDALREHLVDMNNLTLNAGVETERKGNAVTFFVVGTGKTLRAIHKMVPNHARMLSMSSDYAVSVKAVETGAVLTLSSEDQNTLAKIEALGFFGIMASGSHHQMHHLGIANGTMQEH